MLHTSQSWTSTKPSPPLQMSLKRSPSPTPLTESTSANPAKQPKMSSSAIINTPTPLPASAGMQVKRLSERATLPTRGSPLAAGYDLYAAEGKTVPAGGKALVDTQLSIAVPLGTYGRVAPRSGLAAKHSIHTGAGVIDADYRGCVFVLLFNLGKEDFVVNAGDRIAQLVLEQIVTPSIIEVDELDTTIRGSGGFGSTGGFGATAAQVVDQAGEAAQHAGETVRQQAGIVGEKVVEGVQAVGEALMGAGQAQAK
ncbi:hypothetical protein FFLO_04152 [Filobasidium floriforme]|uniref:Deoxyuridine 5'-triphosphate nucleotidohydrolase n=1 Tax=Filobasidium floriforme TaxID=5210 RepID=A0A8K0NML0_9TREE|nr:dUTPase-like protein [Filobasidium floriforme]KAG7531710.1 hypothetical protein FFLO_04152 [Filobasidium floriforme]KAH8085689.1 dUTPase-like protein [Filobasidium floriforme]